MIEIRKTDKRHTGSQHFAYLIEVKRSGGHFDRSARIAEFDQLRQWCWSTWGPSCDREHWLTMHSKFPVNEHWCWHTEFNELKIYLASDKEVTWAKLKWS